ncbi:hypothetical protein FEH16_25310 [Escherichia coli]|nr:hypothetical protein [Escherichia coli]EFC6895711.1 hypothetical protein [Escherichia coli]
MAFCCAGSASLAAVVYAFITDLINYHILRILLICNISLTISGYKLSCFQRGSPAEYSRVN